MHREGKHHIFSNLFRPKYLQLVHCNFQLRIHHVNSLILAISQEMACLTMFTRGSISNSRSSVVPTSLRAANWLIPSAALINFHTQWSSGRRPVTIKDYTEPHIRSWSCWQHVEHLLEIFNRYLVIQHTHMIHRLRLRKTCLLWSVAQLSWWLGTPNLAIFIFNCTCNNHDDWTTSLSWLQRIYFFFKLDLVYEVLDKQAIAY